MYAIKTDENKKTLYVSDYSKRSLDGKYLVEYSEDQTSAKRMTRTEAKDILPLIHNPFERKFEIIPIAGKQKKVIAATEDLS